MAGVLRVYQVCDDCFAEPLHRHPPLSLLEELDVVAEDGQAHINTNTSGAGAGKTGAQISFAGATNAAASKVAASVASSNALSVTSSNTQVVSTAKGKVLTVASAKGKMHPVAALGWFLWLRATLSIGFAVKSMCMMCNIFYQASPLPLINDYRFKGDTGDADLAPFIATAYGGWQWCFYGLFAYIVTGKSGFLVLVYSNVVGATLGLYYVYSFNVNCHDSAMMEKRTKYYYVLASIVAIQAVAITSMQPVKALFFCGLISSAWSTIASASLVATVPKVFATRNSRSLPLPLLVMGTVSAALWIVCGIMLWDPWITFPNMFAICVCTGALYLCHIFPADGSAEGDCYKSDATALEDRNANQNGIDVERPSPLQRALGLVSRPSLIGDAKDQAGEYGGTGGTGDSF